MKQCCTELPPFHFSLHCMVELRSSLNHFSLLLSHGGISSRVGVRVVFNYNRSPRRATWHQIFKGCSFHKIDFLIFFKFFLVW